MKRYRIGDFARELGVTPDFLKYCEKHGYLTPQTEPNGYRYYDFTSAAPVIEYMKLRNQGFTAREINEALRESSFGGTIARMESRREELTRHIADTERVLSMMTIEPARLLGIDAQTGSISVGKRADLTVFTMNPLTDFRARVVRTMIAGRTVYQEGDEIKCYC